MSSCGRTKQKRPRSDHSGCRPSRNRSTASAACQTISCHKPRYLWGGRAHRTGQVDRGLEAREQRRRRLRVRSLEHRPPATDRKPGDAAILLTMSCGPRLVNGLAPWRLGAPRGGGGASEEVSRTTRCEEHRTRREGHARNHQAEEHPPPSPPSSFLEEEVDVHRRSLDRDIVTSNCVRL